MAKDKDDFELDDKPGIEDNAEASLDDFFQPAETSAAGAAEPSIDDFFAEPADLPAVKGKPAPKSAPKPAASDAPLELDDADELPGAESEVKKPAQVKPALPPGDDEIAPGEAAPPDIEAGAEAPAKKKSAIPMFLIVGILVIGIVGLAAVGGYIGYQKFFAAKPGPAEVAKTEPKDKTSKPKDAKTPADPGKKSEPDKDAVTDTGKKEEPAKPADKAAEPAKTPAEPAKTPADAGKKTEPAKTPVADAGKKSEPSKPADKAAETPKTPTEPAKTPADAGKKTEPAKTPVADAGKKSEPAKTPAEPAKTPADAGKKTEPAKTPVADAGKKSEPAKTPAEPAKTPADAGKKTEPAKTPVADAGKKSEPAKDAKSGKDDKSGKTAVASLEPKTLPPVKGEIDKMPSANHAAVSSDGGPFSVQVGSYYLEASKKHPVDKLSELGYTDYHFSPEHRRIRLYHVLVGKDLSNADAQQLKSQLEGMGYAAELYQGGSVKAYSYGNSATADKTRSKLAAAGLPSPRVTVENTAATLEQLRVGRYSRARAAKAVGDLRKAGFGGAEIVRD